VQYEEIIDDLEEDEDFLKNPTPFQRAYRRANDHAPQVISVDFKEPTAIKPTKVKDVIRKSIRRLIHKNDYQEQNKENKENKTEHHGFMSTIRHSLKFHHKSDEKLNKEENSHHHGLISTIRHSLRRKDKHQHLKEEKTDCNLDMSVIGDEPRKVYRETVDEKPIVPIVAPSNPTTFIRSSLRRSTRDAKRGVKTVIKKAAEI
jgi:hypothetical protein